MSEAILEAAKLALQIYRERGEESEADRLEEELQRVEDQNRKLRETVQRLKHQQPVTFHTLPQSMRVEFDEIVRLVDE